MVTGSPVAVTAELGLVFADVVANAGFAALFLFLHFLEHAFDILDWTAGPDAGCQSSHDDQNTPSTPGPGPSIPQSCLSWVITLSTIDTLDISNLLQLLCDESLFPLSLP